MLDAYAGTGKYDLSCSESQKNLEYKQGLWPLLHHRDALEALTALLLFKEKRGLVFIDPSYEVKQEYHQLTEKLVKIYQRFSHGIYYGIPLREISSTADLSAQSLPLQINMGLRIATLFFYFTWFTR